MTDDTRKALADDIELLQRNGADLSHDFNQFGMIVAALRAPSPSPGRETLSHSDKLADELTEAARHKSYWSMDDAKLVLRAAEVVRLTATNPEPVAPTEKQLEDILSTLWITREDGTHVIMGIDNAVSAILALTATVPPSPEPGGSEAISEEKLIRTIAQADFIWQLGEDGVMACNPDLAGKMFDEAWGNAESPVRQKFKHIAQVVIASLSSPPSPAVEREAPTGETPTNAEIARRMKQTYDVTGDRWFSYAATALSGETSGSKSSAEQTATAVREAPAVPTVPPSGAIRSNAAGDPATGAGRPTSRIGFAFCTTRPAT